MSLEVVVAYHIFLPSLTETLLIEYVVWDKELKAYPLPFFHLLHDSCNTVLGEVGV